MSTFVKTRAAAGYVCRHTLSDLTRQRALILAEKLGACDAALDAMPGEPPPAVQGLLRDLVHAVRELAGSAWLAANGDDPDIAALTGLDDTPSPPAPHDLDEILSRCLWARFAPPPADAAPTTAMAHRPCCNNSNVPSTPACTAVTPAAGSPPASSPPAVRA